MCGYTLCHSSLAFVLSSCSCHRPSDFGPYTHRAGTKPTSCWCWLEKRGRHGCLLDDRWDEKDPSEAPPQGSPRSDTILYSPPPFGKTCTMSQKWGFVEKYCKYNTYLFFTDLMVDLVLKSLFDPSKRHVPIISGNILTEAERRENDGMKNLNPFSLLHH